MRKSEKHTEHLIQKEMKFSLDGYFDINNNKIGEVYEQGSFGNVENIKEALSECGGKPKLCSLRDFTTVGLGNGKPEFILTFHNLPDTIIVIEAKNTISKHESHLLDKPKDFAVDGVLYYAKYLKKYFNVIAIAVSGTSKDKFKTSTFQWKKNEDEFNVIKQGTNNFLTSTNIINILEGKKIIKKYDEGEIQLLALELHDKLRLLGVTEKEKPLFIASILIALQNKEFISEYSNMKSHNTIVTQMKNVINIQLESNNISFDKIKYLKNGLDQISKNEKMKNIPLLEDNSIRWYIEKLELTILPMMNLDDSVHSETGDALGKFYHEFIKYSGGDGKGLGIVLTPQHITELMVELTEVKPNDKILDPACGSGAFLVSAMNKMFNGQNPDYEYIKKHGLHGVEINTDLWVLSMTNMIVRGDGKSNITHGSCFDKKIISNLKSENITVGLINPPYAQKDYTEIQFIDNMLDILTVNGLGAAIVPLSSAIGTKFKEDRENIMRKHKLLAVFSMPEDIFYPNAGTNTCIMVWKAHCPHDVKEETFFGFYKDDGFIKKKKLGRVDHYNKWELIKEEWLRLYKYKDIKDGLSARKCVTHEDEWLVEAYMKTDYSRMKEDDFIQTIRDYLAFKIKSGEFDE